MDAQQESHTDLADQTWVHECRDCHVAYTTTKGEREYLTSHGLSIPKRCLECRRRRKAENEARGNGWDRSMENWN